MLDKDEKISHVDQMQPMFIAAILLLKQIFTKQV